MTSRTLTGAEGNSSLHLTNTSDVIGASYGTDIKMFVEEGHSYPNDVFSMTTMMRAGK